MNANTAIIQGIKVEMMIAENVLYAGLRLQAGINGTAVNVASVIKPVTRITIGEKIAINATYAAKNGKTCIIGMAANVNYVVQSIHRTIIGIYSR